LDSVDLVPRALEQPARLLQLVSEATSLAHQTGRLRGRFFVMYQTPERDVASRRCSPVRIETHIDGGHWPLKTTSFSVKN
jgi:hypothetical protein